MLPSEVYSCLYIYCFGKYFIINYSSLHNGYGVNMVLSANTCHDVQGCTAAFIHIVLTRQKAVSLCL